MADTLASSVSSDATRLPLIEASTQPARSAPPMPDGPCPVCPRLAHEFEGWRQANYWKAMHARARQREDRLKQENQQLRAQLRLRQQQLFGRKTESNARATTTATPTTPPDAPPPRPRGQQGPQRRDYPHLPAVVEERDIPKSILGVSILVELLIDKYLSYRPTYRLLADLSCWPKAVRTSEGIGEFGCPLDGFDGVRGTS